MNITKVQLPNITENLKTIYPVPLTSDITVYCVFKQLYREEDVIMDMYLNEITEESIIQSGTKITKEAFLVNPRADIGFNYRVFCIDQDGIKEDVKSYNLHKFYFCFDKKEG